MKNTGKRKILRFVICVLCVLIFASVFLAVRRWLHSEGLHFIIGYGQIHLSKMCEGIDWDGNKIEPRNVVIDGVVTKDWKSEDFWKLDGEVDIVDGLPEDNRIEDKSCFALAWIKDGEIVMEFYQGYDDADGYYIYYSDIKMLDIEQIQDKVNIK